MKELLEGEHEVFLVEYNFLEGEHKDLIARIRSNDKLQDLFVVVYASGDLSKEQLVRTNGSNSILPAPFTDSKIIALFKRAFCLPKQCLFLSDSNHEAFSLAIANMGYDLRRLSGGEAALEDDSPEAPDFIIAEYDLPGMSGVEFLERARESEKLKRVPVLIAYNGRDVDAIETILKVDADEVILSPFSSARNLKRIQDRFPLPPRGRRLRALVVDDSPTIRELIASMFKELDYHVETAENGFDGYKAVQRLKKGSDGEHVTALQERLIQEGYLEGEVDGVYGADLLEAVKLYQDTHQLKQTGLIDKHTRSSLNKSFEHRARQVALALQRHRESELHQGSWRFGEIPVQARVNIPAFEAVFYKDTKPARKHRVVVGSNEISVDEATGFKGHYNRTRTFSEELQTIVINPTWKVPSRIKEQELDPKLIDEPDFYETNNYKVDIGADGSEMVTQLSGENNALGLVKFLFPNRFSIYMHDTPKKKLFNREIRAYSHGCMRTKDALDLARWILVDLEGVKNERFDEILEGGEPYGINLDNRIPITIDYNTVGVHESGRMMFYLDVYKFDRDQIAGKTPYKQPNMGRQTQAVLAD